VLSRYHYYRAPVSAATPPADDWATVMAAKSPTAWWRLGEPSGTTATDEMAVQDGTYVNTPTLGVAGGSGDGDTAATFATASSEYVSIADHATWDAIGTNDFSVCAMVNISSWPTTRGYIFARGNGTATGCWAVHAYESVTDTIRAVILGTQYSLASGITFSTSGWVLLGLSFDRSANVTLYVNGTSAATADISAYVATSLAGIKPLGIGADADTPQYYADFSIDEVALWTSTLLSGTDWADLQAAR
jgi:hypothetical protein